MLRPLTIVRKPSEWLRNPYSMWDLNMMFKKRKMRLHVPPLVNSLVAWSDSMRAEERMGGVGYNVSKRRRRKNAVIPGCLLMHHDLKLCKRLNTFAQSKRGACVNSPRNRRRAPLSPSIPILPSPSLSAALRNAFVSSSVRSLPSLENPLRMYLSTKATTTREWCAGWSVLS